MDKGNSKPLHGDFLTTELRLGEDQEGEQRQAGDTDVLQVWNTSTASTSSGTSCWQRTSSPGHTSKPLKHHATEEYPQSNYLQGLCIRCCLLLQGNIEKQFVDDVSFADLNTGEREEVDGHRYGNTTDMEDRRNGRRYHLVTRP